MVEEEYGTDDDAKKIIPNEDPTIDLKIKDLLAVKWCSRFENAIDQASKSRSDKKGSLGRNITIDCYVPGRTVEDRYTTDLPLKPSNQRIEIVKRWKNNWFCD